VRRGITPADLVGMTIISTMLFLVYPTLLWRAPVGASHVGRFVVSYLTVIPLAAGVTLLRLGRLRAYDLVGAVAIVWAVKMLLTVGLYHFMVQGTAPHLDPVHTEQTIARRIDGPYVAVPAFEGRTLAGRVSDGRGNPLPGALVVVPIVGRGKPFDDSASQAALEFTAGGLVPRLAVLTLGRRIRLRNRTDATVVLRATFVDRGAFNIAVLPGEEVETAKQQHAGLMKIEAAGDDATTGWCYVADNPYWARADGEGRFSISDVPAEARELEVHAVVAGELLGTRMRDADGTQMELAVDGPLSSEGGR